MASGPSPADEHDGDAALQAQLAEARATIAELEHKYTTLERALDSSRAIGMAMGIIMAGERVGPDEAFEVLKTIASQRHEKIRDVVDQIVLTGQYGQA